MESREFAMFGVKLVERGYDQAREWLEIIERAYAAEAPFDFEGEYYRLKGVVSRPASVQSPRPVTMNAAFGDPGRDFAAQNCDFLFTTFTELGEGRRHVADISERAQAYGREVGVYTVCHVVCRETQAEAEAYYDRYADRLADHEAVDAHMSGKKEFSNSHGSDAYVRYRKRFAGGAGSYPLIGRPSASSTKCSASRSRAIPAPLWSFVNYAYELPFFCEACCL